MAAAEAGGDPAAAPGPSGSPCSSESASLKEDVLPYPGMLPVDKRLLTLQIYKLLQCVHEKDKKQIENLIQKGFPDLINYTEPKEGYSAFHLASMKNDIEMCRFLLEHGAHPNVHDKMGRTPAMKAAELGHEVILELLVKANADMTAVDNEGKGILFYCLATTGRHSHCLQLALEHGADVNNCTTSGRSVLLEACERAQEVKEICLIFLERGANPNARDPATWRTAVMEATRQGVPEVVRALLQKGADVNLFDFERHSAAHFAAKGGFLEILMIISGYKADLTLVAMSGNTPLHYAADGGFADCCRYIAQRGCDPTWPNLSHLTPREVAKEHGFKAAAAALRKAEKAFKKVNDTLIWYVKLYDWSVEHEDALREEFEVDEEDGMVSRTDFMAVIQKHWPTVDEGKIETLAKKLEGARSDKINPDDFFKGSKYLQKAFLLSSYGPKAVKKKKKPARKKGKKGLPVPVCVIPKSECPLWEDGFPTYLVEAVPNIPEEQRFKRDLQSAHPVLDDRAWYVDEPRKTYRDINYLVRAADYVSLQKAFDEGVPVDIKDKYYKTPLMVACASGNIVLVEFLLEKRIHININISGKAAVVIALVPAKTNSTWIFTHPGNDTDIPGTYGKMCNKESEVNEIWSDGKFYARWAENAAEFLNHCCIVPVSIDWADVNATDNFLWTPLHHACYNGHLDIAKMLVKAGAAVNAPAIGGATPLMRAVEACRLDMVYFLITAGADIQATNSNGKNALDLAQVFEDATIIDLLENKLRILEEEQEREKEEAKATKGGKPKPAEPQKPVKKETPDVSQPAEEKPVPEKMKRSRKDSAAYWKSLLGKKDKNDISFRPRKIWSPDATAMELAKKEELLREHNTLCGHMEDFTPLFNRTFNK